MQSSFIWCSYAPGFSSGPSGLILINLSFVRNAMVMRKGNEEEFLRAWCHLINSEAWKTVINYCCRVFTGLSLKDSMP